MKLFSLAFLLWGTILVQAIPDNYEQKLQPRSFDGFPGVSWFYSDDSNHAKPEEITDKVKNEGEIHVMPIEKTELNDTPEPIENFFKELQEKADEESVNAKIPYKDDENLMNVLKELNKTVAKTPTELVKVLVNNTWRIFDIGALGSSRRTRNVNQTSYLVSLPDLLQLLSQFLGFSSSTTENNQQENITSGSQTPQFKSSVQQNVPKDHIAIPSGMLKKQESFKPTFNLSVNKENKEKANNIFNSQEPNEIIKKMREFLENPYSTIEDKFYIVLKLDDMFDHLHEIEDDDTKLNVLHSIINVGGYKKFAEVFNKLKSVRTIPIIYDKYNKIRLEVETETIVIWRTSSKTVKIPYPIEFAPLIEIFARKNVEQEALSDNCFVTRPIGEKIGNSMLYRNTWNPESDDDFYKFCYDDETVTQATKAMMINDADSMRFKVFRIKSNSNGMLLRGPMYKWYTIVKLYNMHENLKAERKDEDSKSEQEGKEPKPEKEAENENDKKELVDLMTEMGEDTQYERIFESLKAANKPLLTKIWTAFKDNGKKPEENNPYQRLGSRRYPWSWSRSRTWSNRY